jgi:ribosomal protein S18 acetylase RimI-like enzyme
MTKIVQAGIADASLLSQIARITFIESHGHSASPEDINSYVTATYNIQKLEEELSDTNNNYHLLYLDDRIAGYSKIVFNSTYAGSPVQHITKLDRIYLLQEFHHLKLGTQLLEFIINLAKQNHQCGIWLFVWTANEKAVNFYTQNGFSIIGSHEFKISPRHSNPNHQMLLLW